MIADAARKGEVSPSKTVIWSEEIDDAVFKPE